MEIWGSALDMLGLYNHQVGERPARRKRTNLTAEVLRTFDATDPQSWIAGRNTAAE